MSDEPVAASVAYDDEAIPSEPLTFCEEGTIGWEDSDDYFELGTAANDGLLLHRVQLFKGRAPGTEIKPGVGQGVQLVCRTSAMCGHRVLAKGTRVVVMIPGGDITSPGNPVIVATIEKNPSTQIDPKRVVLTFGDDVHVVIKGMSATLQDTNGDSKNGGPFCWIGVGTPFTGGDRGIACATEQGAGFTAQGKTFGAWGSDGTEAKSMLQLNDQDSSLLFKGSTECLVKLDGDATIFGAAAYVQGSGVYLGNPATMAATPGFGTATGKAAFIGAGGPSASSSVFVAP